MKTLEELLEPVTLEHTPTPWGALEVNDGFDNGYLLINGQQELNDETDLEFASHCVNSHEQLRKLAVMADKLAEALDVSIKLLDHHVGNDISQEVEQSMLKTLANYKEVKQAIGEE